MSTSVIIIEDRFESARRAAINRLSGSSPIIITQTAKPDPQRFVMRNMAFVMSMLHSFDTPMKPHGRHTRPRSSTRGKPAGLIRRQIMARRAKDS